MPVFPMTQTYEFKKKNETVIKIGLQRAPLPWLIPFKSGGFNGYIVHRSCTISILLP